MARSVVSRRFLGYSKSKKITMLAAVAAVTVSSNVLGQISASWVTAVDGTWSVGTNWSGGSFPTGGGAATFNNAGTVTVTLDTNVSLGSINFTAGTYTIGAGGGAITMVGPALLNATTSTSTINANISTAGILTKSGGGTLILNGTNTMTALHAGQGTLVVNTALPANIPLTIGAFTNATGHLLLGSNPASFSSITMPYNNAGTTGGTLNTNAELTLNGNVTYTPNFGSAGSTPLIFGGTGSLNIGASNRTFNVEYHSNGSGDVQVLTNILGSAGIIKTNTGTLTLSNATNSFAGGVDVQAGALGVGANSTGGPGAVTAGPAGTGVITMGQFTRLQGITSTRTINNNITANGAVIIGSVSLGGTISMPTAVHSLSASGSGTVAGAMTLTGAQPMSFGDLSSGTVNIASNPGYTNATVLNQGSVNLVTATGQLINSSAYTLHGGELTVTTGTVANRFNDAGPMNMSGGSLVFSGSVAAGGYTEDMGDLNFTRAFSNVGATSSSAANNARLTFSNVTRANRASGLIGATSLGQSGSFGTPDPTLNRAYVKISNAANETAFIGTLVGGGAAFSTTSLNNSIVPWMVGATSAGAPNTFLTYEGTGGTGGGNTGAGFIALSISTGSINFDTAIPAANPTNNVRIASGSINIGADATINSLILAGGTLTGTNRVTLTSGAMLSTSSGTHSAAFRAPDELFFTNSSITTTLNGTLSVGNGLTKSGTGTLVLGANNASALSGDMVINGGTVSFSADNNLGDAANDITMYQNSALLYSGADLTLGRTITIGNTNNASNTSPNVANAALSIINVSVATTTLSMTNPLAGAGPGGFLKLGSGTLVTGIAPSMTGLTSVAGGVLSLTGDNSAAPGSFELSASGTVRVTANNNFPGGTAIINNGTMIIGAATTISKDFRLQASGTIDTGANNVTFSGSFLPGQIPGIARPSSFNKIGTGTATYTGAISGPFGSYAVQSGTAVHSGANGTVLPAGSMTVSSGAKLVLNNTTLNANRIGNSTTLTLSGSGAGTLGAAEFIYRGNASTPATETIGHLNITAGGTALAPGAIVSVDPNGSTAGTVVTFASLAPSLNFTLFRGPNLGVDPSTLTPGTPFTQVFFTTPPTLSAGGFITGALYDNMLAGLGIGSATYSSEFGIQLFQTGTFTGNRINNGAPENVPTDSFFMTNGATTFVGNAATILGLTVDTNTPSVILDGATGSGSLNLTGGVLNVLAGNATGVGFGSGGGAASLAFSGAGTLNLNSDVIFGLPLAGTLGFNKSGIATGILQVANTITGPLSVTGGTLALANGVANTVTSLSGSGGTININAGANLTVTASGTYSGSIVGAGSVTVNPGSAATITFGGANSYTGGLNVATLGTVQILNPAGLGAGSVTWANVAARQLLRTNFASGTVANALNLADPGGSFSNAASSQVATLSGAISGGAGTATLRFTGPTDDSSIYILTGNNSGLNVGTVQVDNGQLAITNTNNLGNAETIDLSTSTTISSGSLGGMRLDAANLTFTHGVAVTGSSVINTQANNGTLSGVISGTSQLGKAGSGRLSITNTENTHTGTVTVLAGDLNVRSPGLIADGTNQVQIQDGATLSGDGTVKRPVVVSSGGIVAPGNSVGVLTVGSLSVSTTTFSYESNGITLDRIDMTGALNLTGNSVLNLTGSTLPSGNYTLMNYGTFTGAGTINLGTTPGGAFNYDLLFNLNTLVLNVDAVATAYTWDADPGTAGIQDGNGNWQTGGTANFFNNGTMANEPWANSFSSNVTFGVTTNGSVTIDTPVQANRIIYEQPYTIGGAGITLRSGIIANSDGTLSAPLTMESSNTIEVSLAERTLLVSGGIGEGTTGLSLTKTGPGRLILGGAASYTGATNVTGGTLQISANNQISGATLSLTNATFSTAASLSGGQTISLAGTQNAIAVAASTTNTRNASIVGTGALTKLGDGTLAVTAANTYTGGTTISAGAVNVITGGAMPTSGTLSIGSGARLNLANAATNTVGPISGAAGSTISIGAGANLTIAPASGTQTVSSTITGTGSLVFNPAATGTLNLGAANDYSGGTSVGSFGNLGISNPNALGPGSVSFGNNTTARMLLRVIGIADSTIINDFNLGDAAGTFNHSAANQVATLSGSIAGGAGTATLRFGSGTTNDSTVFILTGNNSGLNVGTVLVDEGQLAITSANSLGNAGTLDLFTATTFATGSLGGLRFDANVTVNTSTLLIRNANVINTQGNNGTITGVAVGSGAFAKAGSGILTLTNAANTHSGTLTVLAGELRAAKYAESVINISAGATAQVLAKGTPNDPSGTAKVTTLSIAGTPALPTAKVDLTNNAAIVDYGTVGTLVDDTRQLLLAGVNIGQGIVSSLGTNARRIGYGDNAIPLLQRTEFFGQMVDNTSLLMMYTVTGDADLNGITDISDFAILGAQFNQPGTVWTSGDFDYNGITDIGDFSLLAAQFNQMLPADLPRGAAVPEPAVLSAAAAAGLLLRRRRSAK